MQDHSLEAKAAETLALLQDFGFCLAAAESCTGGLVMAALTAIPGSSSVVDRGFVVYSNQAKIDMLGVPEPILVAHGAVSAETALCMAEGVLVHSLADIAIAITGIAGPDGGTKEKPVGTVHIVAAAKNIPPLARACLFPGTRPSIRDAAARTALDMAQNIAHTLKSASQSKI